MYCEMGMTYWLEKATKGFEPTANVVKGHGGQALLIGVPPQISDKVNLGAPQPSRDSGTPSRLPYRP
jgi:hypothetical protein